MFTFDLRVDASFLYIIIQLGSYLQIMDICIRYIIDSDREILRKISPPSSIIKVELALMP